jgi:tRNA(fMet)-specific endonuclease VapC
MSIMLLDTDVVSFVMKGDTRAAAYAPHLQGNRLALSFMTIAELFQWAAIRKWGPRRRAQLEQALASYLIIPVDIAMCRLWADIRATRQAAGTPISP